MNNNITNHTIRIDVGLHHSKIERLKGIIYHKAFNIGDIIKVDLIPFKVQDINDLTVKFFPRSGVFRFEVGHSFISSDTDILHFLNRVGCNDLKDFKNCYFRCPDIKDNQVFKKYKLMTFCKFNTFNDLRE